MTSLNTQLLLKQVVWPIRGHFGTVFGLRIKANTGYSASLCFLGCPMRPTSSWVIERSSQYLIYLVIISNSQPYNKFLHIEKKQKKKNFKYQNKKYICIFFYTYTLILLTNIILGSVKLIWYIFQIWYPSDPLLIFFPRGTRLFAVTLTFGEVYVIATKQNIFLQNSCYHFSRRFRPLICTNFS